MQPLSGHLHYIAGVVQRLGGREDSPLPFPASPARPAPLTAAAWLHAAQKSGWR